MRKLLLFLVCLPFTFAISYPAILLARLFLLTDLRHNGGMVTGVWRPWFARRWKYSTFWGYAGGLHPSSVGVPRVIQHEFVHCRQVQDVMLHALAVGAVVAIDGSPWLGLGIWTSGGTWLLLNWLTSWIRGGHFYRDSEHERSAYAQTDTRHVTGGQSWLTIRRKKINRPPDSL